MNNKIEPLLPTTPNTPEKEFYSASQFGTFYRRPYDVIRVWLDILDSSIIALGTAILTLVSADSPITSFVLFVVSMVLLVARSVIADTCNIEDVESRVQEEKLLSTYFTHTRHVHRLWFQKYSAILGLAVLVYVFATVSATLGGQNTSIIYNSCIKRYGRDCCLLGVDCPDLSSSRFIAIADRYYTNSVFIGSLQVLASFGAILLGTSVLMLHLLTYTYIGPNNFEDHGEVVYYHPWEMTTWLAKKGCHSFFQLGIDIKEDRKVKFLPWFIRICNKSIVLLVLFWMIGVSVVVVLTLGLVTNRIYFFFLNAPYLEKENSFDGNLLDSGVDNFFIALQMTCNLFNNTLLPTSKWIM